MTDNCSQLEETSKISGQRGNQKNQLFVYIILKQSRGWLLEIEHYVKQLNRQNLLKGFKSIITYG